MNSPEILIVPDVHGRKFWKVAIDKFPKELYPELKIVFLGDYLDPYESYDGISKEEAFANFEDILEYINNDSRIVPLIGNHDWHYFVNLDHCRIDRAREHNIETLFKNNFSKFRLTYILELDGIKYLFTHAGITQKWLDYIADLAKDEIAHWNPGKGKYYVDPSIDERYKWLNGMSTINVSHDFSLLEKCLQNYDNPFYSSPMSMISHERGGWYAYGSCIWADVYEHLFNEDMKGFYQIFGHTINYPNGQVTDYAISPMGHSWAMLDASKAFVMDVEGNIEPV